MNQYVIQGGKSGRERLRILSRALQPTTLDLFEKAGIQPGQSCLDVGCGGGDVTLDLARLVGTKGHATGIDLDEVKVQIAKAEASEQQVNNVRFEILNVNNMNEDIKFDVVYCRCVLTHLDNPADILNSMIKATKPGGMVIVEDIDFSGYFCYPPNKAFDQYIDFYYKTVHKRGGDPDIGHKLPSMMMQAELTDLRFQAVQPCHTSGEGKMISAITLHAISGPVLEDKLVTEDELDTIHQALNDYTERSDTLISYPRFFQVWGHRPH